MKTIWPLLSSILVLASPAAAQVTLDQWGTYATTGSSVCAENCDPETDLSWFLNLIIEPAVGGATVDIIDTTASDLHGDAFAEASVLGVLGPIVRVDANSLAGGWVTGNAIAVQGYTYTGLVPDTIDVNAGLTGNITNPDHDPATGLAAQVSYIGDANVASTVFENVVLGLGAPDGSVELETTAAGATNLVDVLSIPVLPGEQFYLVVASAASAGGAGASAESLSTLAITFDPSDAENLQAASAPAGVPSLAWPALMVLLGCLTVAGAFAASRSRA